MESGNRTVLLSECESVVFAAYLESIYHPTCSMLEFVISHADELVGDDEDKFWCHKSDRPKGHACIGQAVHFGRLPWRRGIQIGGCKMHREGH